LQTIVKCFHLLQLILSRKPLTSLFLRTLIGLGSIHPKAREDFVSQIRSYKFMWHTKL